MIDFSKAMARTSRDNSKAEGNPFIEGVLEIFLPRPAISAEHDQVDGQRRFEPGIGEQEVYELLRVLPAQTRFEDDTNHGVLVRFIAHRIENREHQCL